MKTDHANGAAMHVWLQRLSALVEAPYVLAHEIVSFEGRMVFAAVEAWGSPGFVAAARRLEGRSVRAFVRPRRCLAEAWPGDLIPSDRFAALSADDVADRGAWPMLWRPARLSGALCTTVENDGRLLGAVHVFRRRPAGPFSRYDLATARDIEGSVLEACIESWAGRPDGGPGGRSFLMYQPDGQRVSRSPDTAAWLDEAETVRRLSEEVVRFSRMAASEAITFLRRARVRLVPLEGESARVLAVVEEGRSHICGAREKLTDTQRRVADLAVSGATVKEIAAALDRSPETVRGHLKAIYERLGIGSRVELGRLLEPPPPPSEPAVELEM